MRFGHLAGNRHQRNRVKLGVSDGCQQVGCSRPRRCETNGGLSGGPSHALCHEAGALFMARQHVMDELRLPERIVDRQDGTARNAGDGANAWRSSRRMVIWAPFSVSVMEGSLRLLAQPAGSKTKTPAGLCRRGW